MDVSLSQQVNRKPPGDFLFIPSLILSLCFFLTTSARFPLFWNLPRFGRVVLIIIAGLLFTPVVKAVISVAWLKLTQIKTWRGSLLPGLLLIAGITIGLLDFWPVRFRQTLHTVGITFSGPASTEIRVLEIRDAQGKLIPIDAYQFGGLWEQDGSAYVAQGGQKASINIKFVGPDEGNVHLLLAEGPTASDVSVTIDRTRKQVSLKTKLIGTRLVVAPLFGQSKTGSLLRLAWFVTFGLILPICLYAALPYGLLSMLSTEKAKEWIYSILLVRHMAFIIVVFLLILQPLRGLNSFDNFDKKFWGREFLLRSFSGSLPFKRVFSAVRGSASTVL